MPIINVINTFIGVPLRGHKDNWRYQPGAEELPNYPGVGNFIDFINFAVQQGKQTLGHHWKVVAVGRRIHSKQYKTLFRPVAMISWLRQ